MSVSALGGKDRLPPIRPVAPTTRKRPIGAVVAVAASFALSACATIERAPFTAQQQQGAVVAGAPAIRFWADAPDAAQRMRPAHTAGGDVTMLALSGGGDDGAYGAGLLNGWSRSGKRPVFSLVTGISTGALIAPFAFLGSDEDKVIERFYTRTSAKDIFRPRFPLAVPASTSAASSKPLARLIAQEVTPDLLNRIAEQHRAGRRLFVGTVNLDAQRLMIWDMGALAASELPGRVDLFRRVLLASASIPGLFPPVPVDVVGQGRMLRELHVDGGTAAAFLSVPSQLVVNDARAPDSGSLTLYLLINGRLTSDFKLVRHPTTFPIAQRALAISQQSALQSLTYTSYLYAKDHGIDWNLAFIGDEVRRSDKPFDPGYMRRLYAYGFAQGEAGGGWRKQPPSGPSEGTWISTTFPPNCRPGGDARRLSGRPSALDPSIYNAVRTRVVRRCPA